MKILGLITYQGHGSTAALIVDGVVCGAASEERFSRIKEDNDFPAQSIQFLLDTNNLKISDIDAVAMAWDPYESFLSHLPMVLKNIFSMSPYIFRKQKENGGISRWQKFLRMAGLKRTFQSHFQFSPPIHYVSHHKAHSFEAYIHSGFKNCLSVVVDGWGEKETISVYEIKEGEHKKIDGIPIPHSVGLMYATVTQFLGFRPFKDEYKVMGMAAYGSPLHLDKIQKLFTERPFRLNLDYFNFQDWRYPLYSQDLCELLGEPDSLSLEDRQSIAFCLQQETVKIVLNLLKEMKAKTDLDSVCFSGGVFQNCLLNQAIREAGLFKNHFVSPLCSDLGTAIGAAAHVNFAKAKEIARSLPGLYQGPSFENEEIEVELKKHKVRYERVDNIEGLAAKFLAEGKVIGWFQGKSELGPRALGNRSILANPTISGMKDHVNNLVKNRENFRPFAPSILEEKLLDYFLLPDQFSDYRYMIETLSVREEVRSLIPAVVHIDSTSRLQVVRKDENKRYYNLISNFYRETGVPMLLNTSFNGNEEPIVNSPEDAMRCYLASELDKLFIGDFLVEKL